MATLIKYVGEDRHGYDPKQGTRGPRLPVPSGARGILIQRSTAGQLVEVKVEGRRIRFWAPKWQLRKLVKK